MTEDVKDVTGDTSAVVLKDLVDGLTPLEPEQRQRILQAAAAFFSLELSEPAPRAVGSDAAPTFSEDRSLSPKEFLLEKQPQSETEKVACLGYYLAHYRDTPVFKTIDISKLNTEAAQRKFSNASVAVRNAATAGFLVLAGKKGAFKQLSAAGEQYVLGLPDRVAARAAKARAMPKRKRRAPPDHGDQGIEYVSGEDDYDPKNPPW